MDLDKAIQNRKSVKHYSEKSPNWRDILECIDSARYAPMAGNVYSMKFILVSEKETIQKIAEASQQDFISKAKYVVIACSDCKKTLNAYGERAEKFCRQQAGAAIENFLLSLENKGLQTCWVGYFVDYLVKEALKIPDDIEVEALFPIGLSSKKLGETRKPARKIELDRIIYFDKWGKRRMGEVRKNIEGRRFGRDIDKK